MRDDRRWLYSSPHSVNYTWPPHLSVSQPIRRTPWHTCVWPRLRGGGGVNQVSGVYHTYPSDSNWPLKCHRIAQRIILKYNFAMMAKGITVKSRWEGDRINRPTLRIHQTTDRSGGDKRVIEGHSFYLHALDISSSLFLYVWKLLAGGGGLGWAGWECSYRCHLKFHWC